MRELSMNPSHEFDRLRGHVRHDEPMARHISWKVGGPARYFFEPLDEEDVADFLRLLPAHTPILWLGLGSNLLVRDGGFNGAVIAAHRGLNTLALSSENTIMAQAGVSCARVARFAGKNQMGGAEFFAGIPGTVGGAIAMNAGAFGSETWQFVESIRLINRAGEISECEPAAFEVSYRAVSISEDVWVASACFSFEPFSALQSRHVIRSLLETRGQSQPVGQPSAGSVFKNPPGDHAARLIERAGHKGKRIGGARISEHHANFIVNDRSGTAKHIEDLIQFIQDDVEKRFDVKLETEVRFVGESA